MTCGGIKICPVCGRKRRNVKKTVCKGECRAVIDALHEAHRGTNVKEYTEEVEAAAREQVLLRRGRNLSEALRGNL